MHFIGPIKELNVVYLAIMQEHNLIFTVHNAQQYNDYQLWINDEKYYNLARVMVIFITSR